MDDATPPGSAPASPAPAGSPPPTIVDSNDKIWIVLSHLSPLIGVGFILPLVVYLVKKDESEWVAYHAKEALNFHISAFIYLVACALLMLVVIGVFLAMAVGLGVVVLAIIAAIKSANGERYQYPFTIRLIK